MHIYFPIAEVNINMYVLIAIGIFSGIASSVLGIGGGFITAPLLIYLGVQPYIATACSTHQIVGSSFMGVLTKAMPVMFDIHLAIFLSIFSLIGSLFGVLLVQKFVILGHSEVLISLTYMVVMSCASFSILARFIFVRTKKNNTKKYSFIQKMPIQHYFRSSATHISLVFLGILGFILGILTSVMGIGGGFIMVPILTYVLQLKKDKVIGTSLIQIFITTLFVTIMNLYSGESVDLLLGIVLIFGGIIGSYIGGYFSKYIKLDTANFVLAILILLVSVYFAFTLIKTPSHDKMFSVEVRSDKYL